jgi:hypothetical protein
MAAWLALLLAGCGLGRDGSGADGSCAAPAPPPAAAGQGQAGAARAAVKVEDGAMTSFAFGRGAGGGPRTIPLELAPALPVDTALAVQARPFVREDGLQIDRDAVHAWALVTGAGRADLTVCVDEEALGHDSGTYRGGVLISDSRVQPTVVAVSLHTFPSLWWMVLAFVGCCLLGSLYIYALRRPTLPEDLRGQGGLHPDNPSILRPSEFWLGYGRWATRLLGALTIASGGATAFVAFNAQYLQADTWNSSRTFGFFGAVLAAFVAGASAGRLAQNVYQKAAGNDRPPDR